MENATLDSCAESNSPFPKTTLRYTRDELLALRDVPASKVKPTKVNKRVPSYLFEPPQKIQQLLMPPFMRNQSNKSGQTAVGRPPSAERKELLPNLRPSSSEIITKDSSNSSSKPGTIHVSLSLNKDVKLNETKNAWRPSHLKKDGSIPQEEKAKEELYRKVRGILNKLTPENFDKLCEQILSLQIDTFEKVNGVMNLVFEKAVDEPNFCVWYSRLCKRLGDIKLTSKGENDSTLNFKTALLNKTELEFKNNVLNREAKERKLQPISQELKECSDPEKIVELKALFEDEERKIRRRSGGTVCFIGELFKNSMLTGNIINNCILSLLDASSEDKLECLCKLLPTVGAKFEATINNKDPKKGTYNLDAVINKMQRIVDKRAENKISNRIRFMLQDVIDLRKNNWISKKKDAVPKTIEQIQKDAKVEQLIQNEMAMIKRDERRHSSRENLGSREGKYYDRDSRKQSDDVWQTQMGRRNKAIDASKLGSMLNTPSSFDSETKLGNSSQFMWTRFTGGAAKEPSQPSSSSVTNTFAALSINPNKKGKGSPRKNNAYKKELAATKLTASPQHSREGSRSNSPKKDIIGFRSPSAIASEEIVSRLIPPHSSKESSRSSSPIEASNIQTSVSEPILSSSPVIPSMPSSPVIPSIPVPNPIKVDESSISFDPEQTQAILRALDDIIEAVMERKMGECVEIVNHFPEEIRWGIFYSILSEYLHLSRVKPLGRKMLANAIQLLLKNKCLTMDEFRKAYKEFSELISDIIIDVPNVWNYIFQFIGPLIHKQVLSVGDLWNDTLKENGQGRHFLKELINYCARQIGPNYTRRLWKTSNLNWSDFLPEDEVQKFIEDNKFQFVEHEDIKAPLPVNRSLDEVMDQLKELLYEGHTIEEIIDYIDGNIANIDDDFIRSLTRTLCDFAIKPSKTSKLDSKRFQNICAPLLLRYIDAKEDRELACLYAVQQLDYILEHPAGLLSELFSELYDSEVISVDSFFKWRDSSEQRRGKGVALKSLNTFFNIIMSSEVSEASD